jgi:chromosomal replication initiator protein
VVVAVSAELEHIWSQITTELAAMVEEPVYRIWLEPLRAVQLVDGRLAVEAPAPSHGWVSERFDRVLQACVAAVLGPDTVIDIVAGPPRAGSRRDRGLSTTPPTAAPQTTPIECGNPKLTFDQFVIGDSNRLAHAAALAVSEMPAHTYNPLFICGPPGVGKTHLLRSIAAFIAAHNPGLYVRNTTGESFTNDFLRALGSSSLDVFKAGFRRVDVLLIDDVQFLERKAKTEEEFFHTFNALHEAGSQIVLSSDRPPRDLQALEDRLRERFQSGLVTDIGPPDLSTRTAILRKRAQHDGVGPIDPDALELIAQRISLNVRVLEGALIRVVAFGSLTGRRLDAELAAEVLDALYTEGEARRCSIDDIKAAACRQFGVSPEELVSNSRAARLTWARQVAMYLARELTDESLPAIGRAFGGRDHTTVLHAWRRMGERVVGSSASREAVEEMRKRLRANPTPIDRPT